MGASSCCGVDRAQDTAPAVIAGTQSTVFAQERPAEVCFEQRRLDEVYDVDTTSQIGQGSNGGVYKAVHKSTLGERAVKTILLKDGSESAAKRKILLLRSIDHPNVAKLYESFKDAKSIYVVTEMCSGGELLDWIMEQSAKVKFNEHKAATYSEQVLAAINYMHVKNIAHRDIKAENVLLSDKSDKAELKLIHFGNARRFTQGTPMTSKVGTTCYMAPEVFRGSYSHKCDVWSCGVLLYIMLSGSPPFDSTDDGELMKQVQTGELSFEGTCWGSISQAAKDMIASLLTVDAESRPEAETFLSHAWTKRGDVKGKQPLPSIVRKMQKFNDARKLKKVCLTMIATQLPRKEIETLRQYFKSLDKNGDGTISRKEMMKGLESQAKALPGMSTEELEKIMNIDTDGSGSIDYTEFLAAAIDRQTYQQRDVLWSAFRTFDKDGNGKIETIELGAIMKSSAGKVMDEAKIKAMMAEADQNDDGFIDFEEFMKMMSDD